MQEKVLALEDYIARFRDRERVEGYCRECMNFGRKWSCPPFGDEGPLAGFSMEDYSMIKLLLAEVPSEGSWAGDGFSKAREKVDALIFEMERSTVGAYALLPGTCLLCKTCGKSSGVCHFPSKVRPSLEALGFDVAKTMSELFGAELEWAKDGAAPKQYRLVGALLLK